MSTRRGTPVIFDPPETTNTSEAARARLILDRLRPKAEWLNYIKQRADVPAHMKTAASFDRFENEIRKLTA